MGMIPGSTDAAGRTWSRCPSCNDSQKNTNRAHYFVDLHGAGYCYRCGYSHRPSIDETIEAALQGVQIDITKPVPVARQLGGSSRPSCLERWRVVGQFIDSFQMRNYAGRRIGWHDRWVGEKQFKNEGQRGIGYVGEVLLSSPSNPIVCVEGPYDVITDRHVCVFGTISVSSTRHLRLQSVWLFPDPDILETAAKRRRFIEMVHKINDNMVFVQGIIIGNADPDICTLWEHIPYNEL